MSVQHFKKDLCILFTLILVLPLAVVSKAGCSKAGKSSRTFKPRYCNSSELEGEIKNQLQSTVTTLIIPTIYTFVLILGLPANGIAFWVLMFKTKKIPSTLLLINLAAADLLFMMALPFKITYHFLGNDWIFGEPACRVVTAIFYGNMYCSVLFLMAISIDRYIALVHPFSRIWLRGWGSSIGISTAIWVVVTAGMMVFLLVPQTKDFQIPCITTCHEIWPLCSGYDWYTYSFLGIFTIGFAIPLGIIIFFYVLVLVALVRSRDSHRRVIKLIVLVLLMFILFFTPSNILLLLHYLEHEWEKHNQLYISYAIALSITSLNSCIDPFIYYFMSKDFWALVKGLFFKETDGNSKSIESTKKTNVLKSSSNKEQSQII